MITTSSMSSACVQNIYGFRHKECWVNIPGVNHGPNKHVGGTEKGNASLKTLADLLQTANFIQGIPNVIFSSPIVRSAETAVPFCERYPDVPFEYKDSLREFVPIDAPEGGILDAQEKAELTRQYWKACNPTIKGNTHGESFKDHVDRVYALKDEILNCPQQTIVLVTHGYVLRNLCEAFKGNLQATPEAMRICRADGKLDFLDAVEYGINHQDNEFTAQHYVFEEGYKQAYDYPVHTVPLQAKRPEIIYG